VHSIFHREGQLFPFVIGVTDGILTALTLAGGRIFERSQPITLGLAFRISGAASLSGVFVFFTAEYIRLRGELARSERQLNLTSGGRLAATRLGRAVLLDTVASAIVSSVCNFLGALIPLIAGTVASWLAVVVALSFLGALGLGAARAVHGSSAVWALALVLAGGILTVAGIKFRIV
jgi:hypothetical protein